MASRLLLWQAPISVLVAMIPLNTTPGIAHKHIGPQFDMTNFIHKAVFFAGFAVAFFEIMISLARANGLLHDRSPSPLVVSPLKS